LPEPLPVRKREPKTYKLYKQGSILQSFASAENFQYIRPQILDKFPPKTANTNLMENVEQK
jgi:hypothetical protein